MKAIFLSHIINKSSPVYGGEKSIILKKMKSIKKGDSCNTMFWSFSNHTGTHLDAPAHFIDNGKSISGISPSDLIFNKVEVVRIKRASLDGVIGPGDLKNVYDCELLLIKTGSEMHRNKNIYWKNSVSLDPLLAGWLKKKCPSLRAVGIDCISISSLSKREAGRQAHKAFLGRNILLIEDMRLADLRNKPDLVIAAPILVAGADASPCTVLGIYN